LAFLSTGLDFDSFLGFDKLYFLSVTADFLDDFETTSLDLVVLTIL
jgi:hypothetical protein